MYFGVKIAKIYLKNHKNILIHKNVGKKKKYHNNNRKNSVHFVN